MPHSDIHGSTPARGSPWLFAACHVLHRLLVPRHPPNALIILRSSGRRSAPEPAIHFRANPEVNAGTKTNPAPRGTHRPKPTRGEPRCLPGSFRPDLNRLRHRTRILHRSLRRTATIRINSHNVSEHSLTDLGACPRPSEPQRGRRNTRHTLPVRHQPDSGINDQ